MATLQTGTSKIQEICEILKEETLEPARVEAMTMVEAARKESARIIEEAKTEAQRLIDEAKQAIEKQRSVFKSSLSQAAKLSMEALRQEIEKKLFEPNLKKLMESATSDNEVVAQFVNALVKAVETEGLSADLSAMVPEHLSKEKINSLLLGEVSKQLNGGSVELDGFRGGAKIKMHDQKMTVDLSDAALVEMVATYIRKDFRSALFETAS